MTTQGHKGRAGPQYPYQDLEVRGVKGKVAPQLA